jgi:hypothetical protein
MKIQGLHNEITPAVIVGELNERLPDLAGILVVTVDESGSLDAAACGMTTEEMVYALESIKFDLLTKGE